jgi:hypothetical protein
VLRISGDQRGSVVRGRATPRARIEAANLSTLPSKRLHVAETQPIGRADAKGLFALPFPMRTGDLVQIRSRGEHGRVSPWVVFRAAGIPPPKGVPALSHFRIGLADAGSGRVRIFSLNPGRPIAEPGAEVVFVNQRTSERATLRTGARGNFARNCTLPGRAGDRFVCRIKGVRRAHARLLSVPRRTRAGLGLEDAMVPRLCRRYSFAGTPPCFAVKKLRGRLFEGKPLPEDVHQGQLSDCYLAAAVAALAHAAPEELARTIRRGPGGTYSVVFHARGRQGSRHRRARVEVTAEVYCRPCGEPLYGACSHPSAGRKVLWWPVLEKAYAAWKGGYDRIDRGGHPDRALEEVLGRRRHSRCVRRAPVERVWRTITAWLEEGRPIVGSTAGKPSSLRYRNSGVFPDHCYCIVGCREDGEGRFVRLFNPWGENGHHDGEQRPNGYFSLPLGEFRRLFENISSVS